MATFSLSEYPKKDLSVEQTVADYAINEPLDKATAEKLGNSYDRRDMNRMGKTQELRRNFKFFSIFGYAVILGATWEFALITGVFSLTNGGTAGAVWIFLTVCFGMFFTMLSMAEMASIAPTAGGQYHWVSEFGPPKYQRVLSYAVGWLCVLGWQTALVGVSYAAAQQFNALIVLANPDFVIKGWHGTLFTIAISIFAIIFNTIFVKKLPLLEGIVIILHVFGFFTIIVVLWVLAPRTPAKEVLTHFEDNAGWGNVGLACLISVLGPIATLIGADSSCHLSEELHDAAWVLPRGMVATAIANYIMGFVMTITLMFTIGDVNAALSSPTMQPYVYVLQNATNSTGATITLTAVVAIMMVFCAVNQVTTSSRQLFAFARDGGLPYSKFLSHVRPGWDIPLNAVVVTLIFTALLSLIIIGSTIAFNVLISISVTGLISSYLIAIGCIFAKRFSNENPLPTTRFTLGKWGYLVNTIALCWLILAWVMMFFPSAAHPDAQTMNWNILVFGTFTTFSFVYYLIYGKNQYRGPVEYVRKDF